MQRFDVSAKCIKCGYDDIGSEYHRYASRYTDKPCRLVQDQEHIDRWCKRCHYAWVEAVLGR